MEKRGEMRGQRRYLRSALYGVAGAAAFFGLLLLAAGLSETHGQIMEMKEPLAKVCLIAAALLSGALAGSRAEQGRLLHGLAAEGTLLVALALCAVARGTELRPLSIGVDLLLVLFGAFAGTFLKRKRSVQRRGKR